MVTKSQASRSGTSSATRPARKGEPTRSQYSLAAAGKATTGLYGAIALDTFKTMVDDELQTIFRGQFIPSDLVMTWPLRNRLAMGTSARVRYFVSEAEALEAFPPAPAEKADA